MGKSQNFAEENLKRGSKCRLRWTSCAERSPNKHHTKASHFQWTWSWKLHPSASTPQLPQMQMDKKVKLQALTSTITMQKKENSTSQHRRRNIHSRKTVSPSGRRPVSAKMKAGKKQMKSPTAWLHRARSAQREHRPSQKKITESELR